MYVFLHQIDSSINTRQQDNLLKVTTIRYQLHNRFLIRYLHRVQDMGQLPTRILFVRLKLLVHDVSMLYRYARKIPFIDITTRTQNLADKFQ